MTLIYIYIYIYVCVCVCVCVCLCVCKIGNRSREQSFSLGVGKGATPFHGLLHFILDPYLINLSVKQDHIKFHFWVFCMTRPATKPRSPGLLANTLPTLPTRTKAWYIYIYIYIYIYKYYLVQLNRSWE